MKKYILGLLLLSLSACGWHLRGSMVGNDQSAAAPLNLIIATQDNYSPLLNSLRQSLRTFNITEVTSNTEYTLTIGTEMIDKRTAGVGADALTSAYELIVSAEYSIQQNSQLLTQPKTKASISRSYSYDVNNASTAAQEEALILREIRRDLAQQILRRVKNLSHAQSSTQEKHNAEAAR